MSTTKTADAPAKAGTDTTETTDNAQTAAPAAAPNGSGSRDGRLGGKLKQHVTELLEVAEKAADEVLNAAQTDAERERSDARTQADALRDKAHDEAETARGDAKTEAEEIVGSARSEAEKLTGEAKAEAEKLTTQARSEADVLLTDARTTADNLMEKARAEVEQVRLAVEAEAHDTRRRAKEMATVQSDRITSLSDELAAQAGTAEREVAGLRELLDGAAGKLRAAVAEVESAEAAAAEGATREPEAHPSGKPPRKGRLFGGLRFSRHSEEPRRQSEEPAQADDKDDYTTLARQMLAAGGSPEKVSRKLQELGSPDPDAVLAAAGTQESKAPAGK